MRIVAGSLSGRKLQSLKHKDLRPTTNKIRQKLFNILEHNHNILDCAHLSEIDIILDICSGLGSIAFEGLSRGIKNAMLIDKNRLFGELAEFNADALGVGDRVKFGNYNALHLPTCKNPVSLCFIDPPYNERIEERILIQLIKKQWLKPKAIVILEASKRSRFEIPAQYELLDKREDGITKLIFLKYLGEES